MAVDVDLVDADGEAVQLGPLRLLDRLEEDVFLLFAVGRPEKIAHHHEKYMTDKEGLQFKETKVHVQKIEQSEKNEARLSRQISEIDKKLEELNMHQDGKEDHRL